MKIFEISETLLWDIDLILGRIDKCPPDTIDPLHGIGLILPEKELMIDKTYREC